MMKKLVILIAIIAIAKTIFAQSRYRVLIHDFEPIGNNIQENDGKIIANSIKNYLVNIDTFNVFDIVERENISKIYEDRSNASKLKGIFNDSSAIKLGRALEANCVLLGKVSNPTFLNEIIVSIRLIDVEKSIIIFSKEVNFNNDFENYMQGVKILSTSLADFLTTRQEDQIKIPLSNHFKNLIASLIITYSNNNENYFHYNSLSPYNYRSTIDHLRKKMNRLDPTVIPIGYYLDLEQNATKDSTFIRNSIIITIEGIMFYHHNPNKKVNNYEYLEFNWAQIAEYFIDTNNPNWITITDQVQDRQWKIEWSNNNASRNKSINSFIANLQKRAWYFYYSGSPLN